MELDKRSENIDRNESQSSDMAARSGSIANRAAKFEQLQRQQSGFGGLGKMFSGLP